MKQRISIRAIIRRKDTTLLVRRSSGREQKRGLYELPGGALGEREQPEDSLRRHLLDKLGVSNLNIKLHDATTTVSQAEPSTATLSVVYLVSVAGEKIDLGDDYSRYLWADNNKLQQIDLTESTNDILQKVNVFTSTMPSISPNNDVKNDDNRVIVYTDGGSRGNPGHSAAGFVVLNTEGHVLLEGGEYLGITTNNQAEYHGVRLGLEKVLEMGVKQVDFRLDSMLVVNQMKGIYQIKNRDLWPINERIKELVQKFDKVTFSHVRREFNRHADGMVNKILDAHEHEFA